MVVPIEQNVFFTERKNESKCDTTSLQYGKSLLKSLNYRLNEFNYHLNFCKSLLKSLNNRLNKFNYHLIFFKSLLNVLNYRLIK
jgi:hypothetical protein